jgi:hypothetical protein
MMRKSVFALIIVLTTMPMGLLGQTYKELWKKATTAENKNLPRTEYAVLQQIMSKAEKEKAYGQLMKAELLGAQVMAEIAPDSLKPAVERMQQRCETAKDEVLKTVWQTVLYRLADSNPSLEMKVEKPVLTDELCQKLSRVKDDTYTPFVSVGFDSKIFLHDMLSVVGYELGEYQILHDFYTKAGNRRAACVTAAEAYREAPLEQIDSLIACYGDLQEAGELAIVKYHHLAKTLGDSDADVAAKVDYLQKALNRWGNWKRINILRNAMVRLTRPSYHVDIEHEVWLPQRAQKVSLKKIRNVSSLTMTVYRTKADGDFKKDPRYEEDYQEIVPLLSGVACKQTREYTEKQPYQLFEDSLTLEGLPVGVYMVEFKTKPATEPIRRLYHVTDVYMMVEALPEDEGARYVVVNATTGQPLKDAYLRFKEETGTTDEEVFDAETDVNGEYILKSKTPCRYRDVFAYTDTDRACPEFSRYDCYNFYDRASDVDQISIFTDRAIYRPGQTVHVSALVYRTTKDCEQSVCPGKSLTMILRDANDQELEKKEVVTDNYGLAAVDFFLPSSALTGRFHIQVGNNRQMIRVEEYKRPTFHVDFDDYQEAYRAGDTITVKATALSYAGVPVQGAKVAFRVMRRTAFWWTSYCRYYETATLGYDRGDEQIDSGETKAESDGTFEVKVPLEVPETSYPMFYHFVVVADVTDQGGETHHGELLLPLGNREKALTVDLPEKILNEEMPAVTFHLLNAAGKDIDAEVRYRMDDGAWQTVKTLSPLTLTTLDRRSGKHTLDAICEGDTIHREFVVFSLDDEVPVVETDDWFWQSATQFPDDGSPVTIQVGSSAQDVHIVYGVFAGEKIIEQGFVDKSHQLLNIKATYKEEYGDGLLYTFAWVKEGHCYTHQTKIKRPLPEKKLQLQWTTFRDRLTPGQQEEWTLMVKDAEGRPVDAQLMATLYDQSLDQLAKLPWNFDPTPWLSLPSTSWAADHHLPMAASTSQKVDYYDWDNLLLSRFDSRLHLGSAQMLGYRGIRLKTRATNYMEDYDLAMDSFDEDVPVLNEVAVVGYGVRAARGNITKGVMYRAKETFDVMGNDEGAHEVLAADAADSGEMAEAVQMRENLNETAFFYPQLVTDGEGRIALKFTLPESLTTWRFLGLAHTRDLRYGRIEATTVAKKDVMIQPNVPRFVREGDEATITARVINTSEKNLRGVARLRLRHPETEAVVLELAQEVSVEAGATVPVTFHVQSSKLCDQRSGDGSALLICETTVSGQSFSDGEQHYLPILPAAERVTVTMPVTQHEAGTKTIDIAALMPTDAAQGQVTFEYTNHPTWLMIQALPVLGQPVEENAISQAASYYANSLGRYILAQYPQAKKAFDLWRQELTAPEPVEGAHDFDKLSHRGSLVSQLEKNQELKAIVLNETPWVMDADRETEQKQRLVDFFDANVMQNRLDKALNKMRQLQRSDGSWSWWPDMPGSFYMTVSVSEMLVRLNAMTGTQAETKEMLNTAFVFMGREMVKEVAELKKWEKKGHEVSFPSLKALQWLYLCTLDGRQLPANVQSANSYLLKLLKKDITSQPIYEKAMTAVILSKSDPRRATEYAQSLKEYTVYREEMGRYYDTPRAGYSWFDYRIPTQTMAIEALQRLTPDDRQTIEEMQRWLLQSKRTQAWDTPLNSVDAVYAFLGEQGQDSKPLRLDAENATVKVDGKVLELPKATAAIGYVKTRVPAESRQLSIVKTSEGTSWGTVYVQFSQAAKNVAAAGSGLTIKREILSVSRAQCFDKLSHPVFAVGDRVKVRLTITADRDYDFVQVIDKRAACLEPVHQLSGYHHGGYVTPRDNTTNYYYDLLSKGTHVIETEYYVDRAGTYETGTCVVECAYAPEFRGITPSTMITVEK